VRWFDAVRFCQWLSERERIAEADWCYPGVLETPADKWQFPADLLSRRGYRLPTEAEWEYACRGGSTAAYPFGGDRRLLVRYAWFFDNSGEQSHSVGSLMPNDFGLFDMLGNAHEWCHDAWHNYQTPLNGYIFDDTQAAPPPKLANEFRLLRGGSFDTIARQLRSADRTAAEASKNSQHLGFRVARTESHQTP
jgi:formylglycine-generating enzyme required for sulfatase activity